MIFLYAYIALAVAQILGLAWLYFRYGGSDERSGTYRFWNPIGVFRGASGSQILRPAEWSPPPANSNTEPEVERLRGYLHRQSSTT